MSISMGSVRRAAAGTVAAGAVAGAALFGALPVAQAAPGAVSSGVGGVEVAEQVPMPAGNTIFATDWHLAPMPEHHWWLHHWWHHWWWWW